MRKLELCVSDTLLCAEQDRSRVLFLTEQEFSRSKDNTVSRRCCRGSNMYLQVERKSGVRLECSIEMNKENYLFFENKKGAYNAHRTFLVQK